MKSALEFRHPECIHTLEQPGRVPDEENPLEWQSALQWKHSWLCLHPNSEMQMRTLRHLRRGLICKNCFSLSLKDTDNNFIPVARVPLSSSLIYFLQSRQPAVAIQ